MEYSLCSWTVVGLQELVCSDWKSGHLFLRPTGQTSLHLMLQSCDSEFKPINAVTYVITLNVSIRAFWSIKDYLSVTRAGAAIRVIVIKKALPFHDCSTLTTVSDSFSNSSLLSSCYSSSNWLPPSSGCSVYSSNCRSLLPKIYNLRTIATSTTSSVIVLCETWLGESVPESVLFISHNMAWQKS